MSFGPYLDDLFHWLHSRWIFQPDMWSNTIEYQVWQKWIRVVYRCVYIYIYCQQRVIACYRAHLTRTKQILFKSRSRFLGGSLCLSWFDKVCTVEKNMEPHHPMVNSLTWWQWKLQSLTECKLEDWKIRFWYLKRQSVPFEWWYFVSWLCSYVWAGLLYYDVGSWLLANPGCGRGVATIDLLLLCS